MSAENPSPFDAAPTTYTINPGGRLGAGAAPAAEAPSVQAQVQAPVQAQAARAAKPMAMPALQVPGGLADVVPFLALAARLRLGTPAGDPARLLRSVEAEIARVFDVLPQRGWDGREVQLAKFFVCCAIDNAALNSPLAATWSGNQLSSTFFKNAAGGSKFFANVAAMLSASPGARPPLRLFQLAHLCLVCGFEGRYGIGDSMRENEIEDLKRRLLAVIGEQGHLTAASFLGSGLPTPEPLAARHWRLPIWPIAAVVGAACVIALFVFRALLGRDTDAALAKLDAGARIPLPALSEPAAPPPRGDWIERLRKVADAAGFGVAQDGATVTVTANGGLFKSASDQLRSDFEPVYEQIGALLNEVHGSVIVRGHTDQQPIRSLQFQNNTELSRARARTVGRILLSQLGDKNRIYTKALGEHEPLCGETTAQCLDRNRRVEVVLDPDQ